MFIAFFWRWPWGAKIFGCDENSCWFSEALRKPEASAKSMQRSNIKGFSSTACKKNLTTLSLSYLVQRLATTKYFLYRKNIFNSDFFVSLSIRLDHISFSGIEAKSGHCGRKRLESSHVDVVGDCTDHVTTTKRKVNILLNHHHPHCYRHHVQ